MDINKINCFSEQKQILFKRMDDFSNQPKDVVDNDSFKSLTYKKEDLTKEGLLPVIIWTNDKGKADTVNTLKEMLKNNIKCDLDIINGFAAFIDPKKPIDMNTADGVIFSVDRKISIPEPELENTNRLDVAIPTLGVDKLWEKGYTGKGVTIAVVDTGIHKHTDLVDRIVDFKDIINKKDGKENAYDDQGHGTHCSGDAAGNGKKSNKKYMGPAFEANLMGVKVLNKYGSGSDSDVIKGIEYVYDNKDKYNVKVMSMSLGGDATTTWDKDPCAMAVEKLSNAGVVSVIAAGNSGPGSKTVGSPGTAPSAVTVGALDDRGTVDKKDDRIASFSSRGPTEFDNLVKPNIVTPGVNIMATTKDGGYQSYSGTSMATPIMAGIAACLFQADPDASPEKIKEAVYSTADKLKNYTENDQGAGVADPVEALEYILK